MSEEQVQDSPVEESSAPVESAPAETTTTEAVNVQPQQDSPWEAFKSLPDFEGQDDSSIARSLYESMEREKSATRNLQQYQQLIPYAQEYMQNKDAFEQWRNGSQDQPQQAPAPAPQAPQKAERAAWMGPEVKTEHKRYLVKDENGRDAIAENAPLDARYSLENYLQHRADFAQKFLDNPQDALGPMVQEQAQQIARQMMEEEFFQRDESSYVSSLEKENADWLYEQDGKTPTQEGLAVQRYIQQAADMGIAGAEQRWEYATALVERDLLNRVRQNEAAAAQRQQFNQQLPAQPAQDAAPMQVPAQQVPPVAQNSAEKDIEFLRREASRNPSRGAGQPNQGSSDGGGQSFEERLKSQLQRDNLI